MLTRCSTMLGSPNCSRVLQFGGSLASHPAPCRATRLKGWGHQSWVPTSSWFAGTSASLRVGPSAAATEHSPDFRDSETLWVVGAPVVAKHISLVHLFPRGSLLLIVPAPILFPILINLCQVKPQITCQIADWISPPFPWAFVKKGYRLRWVHYQSGLGCRGVRSVFFCHCQQEKSDLTAAGQDTLSVKL